MDNIIQIYLFKNFLQFKNKFVAEIIENNYHVIELCAL